MENLITRRRTTLVALWDPFPGPKNSELLTGNDLGGLRRITINQTLMDGIVLQRHTRCRYRLQTTGSVSLSRRRLI